jgi:flagellar biosynthesis GTPase FlhF
MRHKLFFILYFYIPILAVASTSTLPTTKLEEKDWQQSHKKTNPPSKQSELESEEEELQKLAKALKELQKKEKVLKERVTQKKKDEKNKTENQENIDHYIMNANNGALANNKDTLQLTLTANTDVISDDFLENTRRCSLKGSITYNNSQKYSIDQFKLPLFKLLDESGKVIPSFTIALPIKKNYYYTIDHMSFDLYILCRRDDNDLILNIKTYNVIN